MDLDFSISDINTVLELSTIYRTNLKDQDKERIYDAKKRLAIILLVTAWETYIEEVIKSEFSSKLRKSNDANEFKGVFRAIAKNRYQNGITADDILKWTGNGWKDLVKSQFEEDLASKKFNTPNADEIGKLFSHYLNIRIKKWWGWKGMTFAKVVKKLDNLINFRGEFAHRSLSQFRVVGHHRHSIKTSDIEKFKEFILRLAECISASLGYKKKNVDITKQAKMNVLNEDEYVSKLELVKPKE